MQTWQQQKNLDLTVISNLAMHITACKLCPRLGLMYFLIKTPQPFTFLDFSEAALRTRLVFVSSVERFSTLTAHASICSRQQCL